jgi:hypothetical protein
MMTVRSLLLLTAGLVVGTGVGVTRAAAQQPGDDGPHHGGSWWHHRGPPHGDRSMHDPVAHLLDAQIALRLTPAQVNNLISIDEKLRSENEAVAARLHAAMMAMHGNRGDGREGRSDSGGGRPDGDARAMVAHDSARALMSTMRENVWRAMAAASAVLTPDQSRTAATLVMLHSHGHEHGGDPGMSSPDGPDGPDGPRDRMGGPRGAGGRPGEAAEAERPGDDESGD